MYVIVVIEEWNWWSIAESKFICFFMLNYIALFTFYLGYLHLFYNNTFNIQQAFSFLWW